MVRGAVRSGPSPTEIQGKIERRSVEKKGKSKKLHNFPAGAVQVSATSWERRLAVLEAATPLSRDEILDIRDLYLVGQIPRDGVPSGMLTLCS